MHHKARPSASSTATAHHSTASQRPHLSICCLGILLLLLPVRLLLVVICSRRHRVPWIPLLLLLLRLLLLLSPLSLGQLPFLNVHVYLSPLIATCWGWGQLHVCLVVPAVKQTLSTPAAAAQQQQPGQSQQAGAQEAVQVWIS
jgi:hypothetical protein